MNLRLQLNKIRKLFIPSLFPGTGNQGGTNMDRVWNTALTKKFARLIDILA